MNGHCPLVQFPVEHFGALASEEHVPPEGMIPPEGAEGPEDGFFIVTLSSIAMITATTSDPKAASSNFIITVR